MVRQDSEKRTVKFQTKKIIEEKAEGILKPFNPEHITSLSVPHHSLLFSISMSFFITAIAIAASFLLKPFFKEEFTYLFLFGALMISMWVGGVIAGITSLLITLLAGFYVLFLPLNSFNSLSKNIHEGIFAAYGIIAIWLYTISTLQRRKMGASEKNKAEIIKNLPFGVLVFSEQKKVLDANHEAEKMFNMSVSSMRSRLFSELIHANEVYGYNKSYESIAITSQKREFPIEIKLLNPSYFELRKIYLCIVRDITSQKIQEEKQKKSLEDEHELRLQAEEEVRAREEFLSIASHELKNPLTSMLLQIQGILHNVKHVSLADFSVDKMMRMLESSEQQSRRLNKMISDLLNVSLITTGRMDLEMEKANLTDIVKDVAMRFTEQLERAGCEFKLIATKPIEMKVDKLRIEQVITNLLSNAIKYGKGKPIVLEVEKDNTIARITVSDKGIGIPPENLERIFNRFERAAVDRKEYKGLGVGLYIASQIVNAHKGVIKVKSKSGEGSEFIVELPIK